ncbi:MAG: hypothetical protein ABIJ00_11835, partial [Candidatus Eisenbacteria bacterium]
ISEGVYSLVIGSYWLDDMTRLTLPDGKSDYFALAAVRVLPTSPVRAKGSNIVGKTFGGAIELIGYDLSLKAVKAGEQLTLVLYWTAVAPVAKELTVFNHVIDGEGRIWGQHDSQPMQGRCPTSVWSPGEVIQDKHTIILDPQAPPGIYRVFIGLYDLSSGDRIRAEDGSDSIALAEIELRR